MKILCAQSQKLCLPLYKIEINHLQMTNQTYSKTLFQILCFLRNYSPKSDLDAKFIRSYLVSEFKITPKTPLFSPVSSSNTLDVQSFTQWLKSPVAAFSVAFYNSHTVILGKCTLSETHIIGILDPESKAIKVCDDIVNPDELECATPEEVAKLYLALLDNGLQPDEKKLELVSKYIPKPLEKVIFHSHDQSIIGLGVVRQVYADGDVELYCYYIYPTTHHEDTIGYSMHELRIVNLRNYVFENMLDDDNRSSSFNGVSCLRRLNRELEKHGKVWKDKLKRIEPLKPTVNKGDKYWYISDKLKVIQDREKDTPTSHLRYLSGNYFKSEKAAQRMLDKWAQSIHDYMASDNWPEIVD